MDKNKTNILIIDDDKELTEEIAEILEDEGYRVTMVHDGLEGKNLLDNNTYNVVLLDLKLPGMNGFDILKYLKAESREEKVIIISAHAVLKSLSLPDVSKEIVKEDKEHFLKLADSIISKPFDMEKLLLQIDQFAKTIE